MFYRCYIPPASEKNYFSENTISSLYTKISMWWPNSTLIQHLQTPLQSSSTFQQINTPTQLFG